MKQDWLQHWLLIGRWVHRVMFEPFIEGCRLNGDKLKELSRKVHTEAWWTNCDNGWKPFEVYALYYIQFGITEKKLLSQWKLARFEVDWRLRRMTESLNKDDWYENSLFDKHISNITHGFRIDNLLMPEQMFGFEMYAPVKVPTTNKTYMVRYIG